MYTMKKMNQENDDESGENRKVEMKTCLQLKTQIEKLNRENLRLRILLTDIKNSINL